MGATKALVGVALAARNWKGAVGTANNWLLYNSTVLFSLSDP